MFVSQTGFFHYDGDIRILETDPRMFQPISTWIHTYYITVITNKSLLNINILFIYITFASLSWIGLSPDRLKPAILKFIRRKNDTCFLLWDVFLRQNNHVTISLIYRH